MKTPDLIGAWLDLTFEPKHPWLTTLKPDHLMNEWWPHSLAAWNMTLHYAVQLTAECTHCTVQYRCTVSAWDLVPSHAQLASYKLLV